MKKTLKMHAQTMQAFYEYNWPGNIRELKNEIYKLVVLAEKEITRDLISSHILDYNSSKGAAAMFNGGVSSLNTIEKAAIEKALLQVKGCKNAAAKTLGISRKTLYNKLKQYHIEV